METTTSEITKRLRIKAIDEFRPYVEALARQGKSEYEIVSIAKKFIEARLKHYYHEARQPKKLGEILERLVGELAKAESRPEVVLFEALTRAEIPFKFQFPIGPFRVDYLVGEDLVIELDGPHHSERIERDERRTRYLERMGYRVLHIPVWVMLMDKAAVLEEIKGQIHRPCWTAKKGEGR